MNSANFTREPLTMNLEEKYAAARQQIEEERGFYTHLITFVLVNAFLIALNLWKSPNHLWFFWSLLGWGIGLTSHAFNVFGKRRFLGEKWEARRMKQLMGEDE